MNTSIVRYLIFIVILGFLVFIYFLFLIAYINPKSIYPVFVAFTKFHAFIFILIFIISLILFRLILRRFSTKKIKKSNDSFFRNNSSKIQKVYIELPSYNHFHAASDPTKVDPSFIGRRKKIDKLKSILTKSETKSGTFLIAGQRGVGKSSYVGEAINEISAGQASLNKQSRFLMLFFIIVLYDYADYYLSFTSQLFQTIISLIVLIVYVYSIIHFYSSNKKRKFKKFFIDLIYSKNNHFWQEMNLIFIAPFSIELSKKSSYRYRVLIQDVIIIITIHYLSILTLSIVHPESYVFNSIDLKYYIRYSLIVFLFIPLSINFIYTAKENIRKLSKKNENLNRKKFWDKLWTGFIGPVFLYPIINYINYSRKIFIKINLGYDDLKELDILRLVARNIMTKYINLHKSYRKNLIWRIFIITFIYIFVGVLYYDSTIYNINSQLKKEISIYDYLPSQRPFFLNDSLNQIQNIIDVSFKKNSSLTYQELQRQLNMKDSLFTQKEFIENISHTSSLKKSVCRITSLIDLFINVIYNDKIRRPIVEGILFNSNFCTNNFPNKLNFIVIPYHIDYLFFIYFFLFWGIIRFLSKFRLFGVIPHRYIIHKLKALNDLIDFQIRTEQSSTFGLKYEKVGLSKAFISSKENYIKTDREIEKELIEILEEIRKVPRYTVRPEFVFVFDELDKIEPYGNSDNLKNNEEANINSVLFSPEGTRSRKQAISKLFSNLKFFLTTAKAKFIFIAGREMYDASLADVSDRNYFIGSIFHTVIYLDSFLTDPSDKKLSDITSMTEQYVCQFLFPESYNFKDSLPSLKEYNKYLLEEHPHDKILEEHPHDKINQSNVSGSGIYKILDDNSHDYFERQKREKIIYQLQHLIVYLTHISRGAPKKIKTHLESFIETPGEEELKKENLLLVRNYRKTDFYLAFNYHDQYKISAINFLINPIILSISNTIKDYGDKLLVSTSFLIDHLFKFHKSGFSWRNLEMAPELIDINKTPELRSFITYIVKYLTQTHLKEIISGLYDFKFVKKISYEMSFLSKTSDEASAIFNFTLDESLAIKQYYQRVLINYRNRYSNAGSNSSGQPEFIHSIASINVMIGDLHFYDEEFGEAILEYKEGIQILRNIPPLKMKVGHVILLVRSMLKLGLAFEKRNALYSAYVTYSELVTLLIGFRDVDLRKLGLSERSTTDSSGNNKIVLVKNDENENYFDEIHPKNLNQESNSDQFIEDNEFLNLISKKITPLKEELLFKISAFEGVRLLYQPLLAKLYIIEKSNLDGISVVDIERVEKEFKYLQRTIKIDEKYLIESEFWNKLADIQYYKNGLINKKTLCKKEGINYLNCSENCVIIREELMKSGNKPSCWACKYYNTALRNLIVKHIEHEDINFVNDKDLITYKIPKLLISTIKTRKFSSHSSIAFKTFANILSNIGDVYLSCALEKEKIRIEFFENYLKLIDLKDYDSFLHYINGDLSKLELTLINYYLSAYFYKKASEDKEYSYQLTKIIYLIREYTNLDSIFLDQLSSFLEPTTKLNNKEVNNLSFENAIIKRVIYSLNRAYNNIQLYEVNRFKNIFSSDDQIFKNDISLDRTFLNTEVSEIVFSFEDLKNRIKSQKIGNEDLTIDNVQTLLEDYMKGNLINPFTQNDSIFNRILRLKYKSKYNFTYLLKLSLIKDNSSLSETMELDFLVNLCKLFQAENDSECKAKNDIPELSQYKEMADFVEFLITDTIFCLHEIIKISNIYGVNFMLNNLFLAYTNLHLADWAKMYNLYITLYDALRQAKSSGLKEAENDNTIDNIYKNLPILDKIVKKLKIRNSNQRKEDIKNIDTSSGIDKENQINQINSDYSKREDNINKRCFDLSKEINSLARTDTIEPNNIGRIKEKLSNLIEEENLFFITETYQAEQALQKLYAALETHSEGKTYRNLIDNMYYLNDDYNDNSIHFSIAVERYKINSGQVINKIKEMRVRYGDSRIFDQENYLVTMKLNNYE